MHVLVTGGTGFIGRALCAQLLNDGYLVDVLTRDRALALKALPAGASAHESLDAIRARPEAIVNVAGVSLGHARWSASFKRELVASRVDLTARLVDYIARLPAKPRVLISQSAVGYYGARGEEPLAEDSPPGDEFQARLCTAWEREARKAQSLGVRVCLMRSGVVLDRDGGALETLIPAFRWGLGASVGHGQQWISWIHRRDLIRVILRLMTDTSLSGAFNVTAPAPARNREFAATLGAALSRPPRLRVPAWTMRVLMGEMAHLYATGQKVLPTRLQQAAFELEYPTLSGALAECVG